MDGKRGLITAATALTVAGMACTGGAQLNISLHDRSDPAPKRVEIAAQVAGFCLGFLLSWSSDAPRPTARF